MESEALSPALFLRYRELLYRQTGIHLADHKLSLVESRLATYVGREKDYPDYRTLLHALETNPSAELLGTFLNALTTNFSFCFRDPIHFQILAWYIHERGPSSRALRFWSAACSSGEEPYSMAITLLSHRENLPSDTRILATDISTKVLAKAAAGVYRTDQVLPHVSPELARRWFTEGDEPGSLRVRDEAKSLITFRSFNLKSPFPFTRPMDVVFLRNVLIYFDTVAKEDVVGRIERILRPGGLLILGLSESLVGVRHSLKMLDHSVYQRTSPA